jgi:hypothetical protein
VIRSGFAGGSTGCEHQLSGEHLAAHLTNLSDGRRRARSLDVCLAEDCAILPTRMEDGILTTAHARQVINWAFDHLDNDKKSAVRFTMYARFGLKFAVCLDGQNACPPDDAGGADGYARFLAATANPDDEEHDDYVDWIGRPFDPGEFDLANANALCQKVR